jgi:hypothetical protein
METLADLRRRGVQPDQKWAEKHGFALSKPKEKGGHFDSAGVYRPSEKEASSWVPDSEYEANEQRYNWRISDAKAKAIEDLVSLFPQDAQSDMRHRAVSALKLSETMGISFEEAFRDLDLYQTEMFPHIKSVETLGQTLDRSAKMAELSRAIAKETGAFRRLPIDEREKRKEAYKTWLDSANAELQKYADAIPANSLVKSLGDTVQSLALMREGLIAGGLAAVAGGIFNPIAGTVASTAITGAMNNELYTNLAYADMFAAGIDDLDIVEQNAGMTGSAQAMTEVLLGMLPMGSVSGVLLKGLAGKAAARFLGKKLTLEGAKSIGDLVKKSVWQQFWLGTAAKPLEIGLEGVEEALQAVEGNANFIKAAEAYEGLVKKNLREEFAQADRDPAFSGLDWSRVYAALEDPEESFKAGIAMALWMGVSFSALGTLPKTAHEVSVKMNLVRELVQTAPNREEAKEAVAEILGDNVSRETSDALVDKIYAETPELSFDEKDDEKPGSIRGMEFSEVIDNPNSADQKLAIFVERGRQNAVFDRTYIPFTVEENDEQYEVTPVVDIDADTAERLAQDTATWYQKETVVISPDGNRYACSPRSENSPGNAGIRQERSEAETLQSADPADPSQVTMDGTERVREQQQAGPTQSDTQPDTVDQGEHPADIDAVPGTSEAATREEPAQQTPSEAWVDLQTGLEVRISPQTGKPVIAVKRGQSLDLKDQGGILERYYQAQEKTQEASHAAQTQEAARPPEAADTGKEPHVGEQASYAPEIREKYESYPSISGNEDVIYVGGKQVHGVWKLVEAAAPSASHDEETFKKTPGFPLTAEQSTINDRDYEHDKDAQEFVITIAQDFNGQALDMGSPVVVTQDGVVISGNNRTMSSKRAANHNSDQEYIEVLKEYRASQYGL